MDFRNFVEYIHIQDTYDVLTGSQRDRIKLAMQNVRSHRPLLYKTAKSRYEDTLRNRILRAQTVKPDCFGITRTQGKDDTIEKSQGSREGEFERSCGKKLQNFQVGRQTSIRDREAKRQQTKIHFIAAANKNHGIAKSPNRTALAGLEIRSKTEI